MNKNRGDILICGASIAGPCLAFWLNRAGFKTTVIERAPKFRDGGQNIDVKGIGKTIVDLMGLTQAIEAKTTREKGLLFVDAKGSTIAKFPKEGELSITQEIEIQRGDLARVFYDATKDQTTYRFGVTIRSVTNKANAVEVEFSDGTIASYDLVVSAEGIGSSTRKLVMNEFVKFNYLGVWTAYFRIPKLSRDDKWARWYNEVGGRVLFLRPSLDETESVCIDFRSDDPNVDHQPLAQQRAELRKMLKNVEWEGKRVAENLDYDDDLYMGPISQVKASRWSVGRFALVGDAAYGPSPITGMGTTLAIAGAYILAGELSKSADTLSALQSYEQILRPFVEKTQSLPPGVPRIAHPKTKLGIGIFNTVIKTAASKPVQTALALFKPKKESASKNEAPDKFVLPTYEF